MLDCLLRILCCFDIVVVIAISCRVSIKHYLCALMVRSLIPVHVLAACMHGRVHEHMHMGSIEGCMQGGPWRVHELGLDRLRAACRGVHGECMSICTWDQLRAACRGVHGECMSWAWID